MTVGQMRLPGLFPHIVLLLHDVCVSLIAIITPASNKLVSDRRENLSPVISGTFHLMNTLAISRSKLLPTN